MISKTSHRYGSFFPTSTFTFKYTLARNFSHHMNVLYLIPRHDRPKEGGKQKISLQVVQNMATKDYIPRVKKSSVKWKCEKEIVHLVHNYSVTGREPRKNVLKINLLLLWAIFLFFQRSLPFSCYIFTSDLTSSTQHQKWCSDIQNITGITW